jgi:hypothetical protein
MCKFEGWAVDPFSFLNHLFFCIFSMCSYWLESFEMLAYVITGYVNAAKLLAFEVPATCTCVVPSAVRNISL